MEPKPLPTDPIIPETSSNADHPVDQDAQTPEITEDMGELTARRDHLKQEANRRAGSIYHTLQHEAIVQLSEVPDQCYDYLSIYNQSTELLVRANSVMPGGEPLTQPRTVDSLTDELNDLFPTLRYHAVVDFAEMTALHVASVSPSKRQRAAMHPEKWNYGALARKYREEFQDVSIEPILSGKIDHGQLVGTLNMAALYSLLSKPDAYPQTKEEATAAAFDFCTKLMRPIIEAKFYRPDNKDKVNATILNNYVDALAGPVVDFPALQKLNEIAGDSAQVYLETAMLQQMVANVQAAYMSVVDMRSMRERVHHAQHVVLDNDPTAFVDSATATLTAIDTEIIPALDEINDKLAALERTADQPAVDVLTTLEHVEQLNWEILPPGEIEKIARDIVRDAQSETQMPTIDLQRLTILENIRQRWGSDDCYYARGALAARKHIHDGEETEADQYLMLILQEKNADGEPVAEHAIAESPIAGPHALYVFRQDVSEGLDWREVMSLPKHYARNFGARKVKHTLPRGETDLVGSMTEKVSALMSATPEEFRVMQFNGTRGLRIPQRLLRSLTA